MTVRTDTTSTKTTADGVAVTFTFGFQTQTSLWVKAQTTDPGGTPVDRLDITTVINDDQDNNPGGFVTFGTAPVVGALVNLYRETPQTQLTNYTDYSAFPAESTENALDKLTFITQEIETPGTAPSECDGFLPLAGGVMV